MPMALQQLYWCGMFQQPSIHDPRKPLPKGPCSGPWFPPLLWRTLPGLLRGESLACCWEDGCSTPYVRLSGRALRRRLDLPTHRPRQGDPLSVHLFNVSINWALDCLDPQLGVMVGEVRVNAGAFADNIALIAWTSGGLQPCC